MSREQSEQIQRALVYFEERRGIYDSLGVTLENLIRELTHVEGIEVFQIERRVKTSHSLQRKLEEKQYDNPEVELTDFCGVRVIAYDLDASDKIVKLIRGQFDVDEGNSSDKRVDAPRGYFGYRSVHIIVKLKAFRGELPEYGRFKDLCAELQVRTIAEHAWATISHKIGYKEYGETPADLENLLAMSSAFLKQVDEHFRQVTRSVEQFQSTIEGHLADGNLNIPVNFYSLKAYLRISKALPQLVSVAINHGYNPDNPPHADLFERRLLGAAKMCTFLKIATIETLDVYLGSSLDWAECWLEDLLKIGARHQAPWNVPSAAPLSVLRHMLVGHASPGLTVEQLDECACGGAVLEDLVQARIENVLGRSGGKS